MDKKENLKRLLQSNHCAVKALIDDISEEESMRHDYPHCNHIRWQTGHLAYSAHVVLKMLGEKSGIEEEWIKLFGRGPKIYDNASIYPSMQELRDRLYSYYDKIFPALEKVTTEYLDTEQEFAPTWKSTPMDGILFFCTHEFYHAGQITVMRRVLGRDKPFG